jgi:predicted nucleic acid-binding protein
MGELYLLDTNIISELRKKKPHGGVQAWFDLYGVGQSNISAVSFYEMQAGAEITRRQDIAKTNELDRWIGAVEASITVRPFGTMEARMTAYLMRSESRDLLIDAMIAATAITNELTVVTRNIRDFKRFGVSLIDPFAFKPAL